MFVSIKRTGPVLENLAKMDLVFSFWFDPNFLSHTMDRKITFILQSMATLSEA
jgi:hypothetical protein